MVLALDPLAGWSKVVVFDAQSSGRFVSFGQLGAVHVEAARPWHPTSSRARNLGWGRPDLMV